ncbi:tyrosine-type recombinase/integrase [Geobacter sp. SVR]|uniref:tyrosine-type recombinase/integrase n=1 Tax=Geobacter sp. SVR TaxID=2495594 RepID=UPI00143EFB08|nr:tyrosine-type recombinase/integrase [Geobacter sp. SVR]BCS55644.1 tyrosine recombinase XerC [Geobacter sp. SVR]GCF83648.1 tyrosine recombinase XerC [Geobacter sp. SVR]
MTHIMKEHIDGFIFHCQYEKNLNHKTIKAYRIDLRQFAEFLGREYPGIRIDLIDKHILRDYIKHVSTGNKPKTIKRKLATLKAFFNQLEFEDIILVNPFRKIRIRIKEGKHLPRTIPRHDIAHLFDSMYALQDETLKIGVPNRRTLARDIAVLELLFSAGVRVAELCCLRGEDVDLQRGSVRIMGKGTRERIIPLCSEETVSALTCYAGLYRREIETAGWFFINRDGRRFSEQSVRFMLRKYVLDAEIPERITPHMFRHSVATQLLENGVDIRYIQTFLGHSSITTTQIYAQVTEEFQRQALQSRHPRRGFGRERMVDN